MATNGGKPQLKLQTSQTEADMPPPRATEPKPILKLATGSRAGSVSADVSATPTPSGVEKKIKIKISASQPSTPAASGTPTSSSIKTKAGRSSKPTAKLLESKKRAYDSDEEDQQPLAASRPSKKQRFRVKPPNSQETQTPASAAPAGPINLRVRAKCELAKHTPGDGYDSEASDKEMDPLREQVVILRTLPGPSTEYLHKALQEGTIGVGKNNGGADFAVQYIESKERRAIVTVNSKHYAAVLVDLPTITEAYKTWDRKAMMKNSDVTQMLLCFAEVPDEREARTIPIPPMAKTAEFKWPHGLTPPMHDAVNRRFRKQMSEKELIELNNEVKTLLHRDAEALETSVEYLNEVSEDSGDEDAEGELEGDDYFSQQQVEMDEDDDMNAMDEDDLLAQFEAAEVENEGMEGATPTTQMDAQTPGMGEAMTPVAAPAISTAPGETSDVEDEEDEEISDEEDDDDDDDEDMDEEQAAKQAELRGIRDDMHQLQKQLAEQEAKLLGVTNPILRQRIQRNMLQITAEIDLKKTALGITDD